MPNVYVVIKCRKAKNKDGHETNRFYYEEKVTFTRRVDINLSKEKRQKYEQAFLAAVEAEQNTPLRVSDIETGSYIAKDGKTVPTNSCWFEEFVE